MSTCADDDADCEVIFENSPLYWSMVDAGLGDIGKEDVCQINSASPVNSGIRSTNHSKQSLSCRLREWCCQGFSALCSCKFTSKAQVEEAHRQVFQTLASCSSLLTEEDDQFLHDLRVTEGQERGMEATSHATSWKQSAVLYTSIACLLFWAFCPWRPLPFTFLPWEPFIANTLVVLFLPVVLIQTAREWHRRSLQRKGEVLLASIKRVLGTAGMWNDISAKCVRFIQESELVARGFTFVGKAGSSRVVKELQPLMSSNQQQRHCPLLRKALFLAGRSAFHTWRHSFAHLVQVCPVKAEVSGMTRYCSEIPLLQYPLMLQQVDCGRTGEHEEAMITSLHELSDGFSIDVLKSLQELNRIHMSEFFRRLAVCFVETTAETYMFNIIPSLLDILSHELERLSADLQSCLSTHRYRSVNATACRNRKTLTWQLGSTTSQLQCTYTAVHSLELHLLAALNKIQVLSESMERKLDEEKSQSQRARADESSEAQEEVKVLEREKWIQMLLAVRSELGACSGCLEEGMKKLDQRNVQEPGKAALEPKADALVTSPSANTIKVSAQDTPIIMDEVFEAYSEPQDYDNCRRHYDLTASEEEVWQNKQKSSVKLCLRELQSVINVRATQRQERERQALDRMRGIIDSATHTARPEAGISPQTIGREPHDDLSRLPGPEERQLPCRSTSSWESLERKSIAESSDDLANDVAERVEFWKQFNISMNFGTATAVCSKTEKHADFAEVEKQFYQSAEEEQKQMDQAANTTEVAECRTKRQAQTITDSNNESKVIKDLDEIDFVVDKMMLSKGGKHTAEEKWYCCRKPENSRDIWNEGNSEFVEVLSASSSQDSSFVVVNNPLADSISTAQNHRPDLIQSLQSPLSSLSETTQDLPGKFSCSSSSEFSPLEEIDRSHCCENDCNQEVGIIQETKETECGTNSGDERNLVSSFNRTATTVCQNTEHKMGESMRDVPESVAEMRDAPESVAKTGDALEIMAERREAPESIALKIDALESVAVMRDALDSVAKIGDAPAKMRDMPESTEEHLSMPSAPSPFAFSLASIVAARARSFARTEDTFGDSSSEDGEGYDEG